MDGFLKTIGTVVLAGGGISAIVYAAFKLLAQKWLEAKFSERLETYKHEQQKQIEKLKFNINSLFDRTTKLHQKEFEILPETWARLNDAFWITTGFVSPLQQYPDLNRMTQTQLDEFLDGSPLKKWEKEELSNLQDKTEYYSKRIFWHSLNEVKEKARDLHIYTLKNGIFLPPEIREKFREIEDIVWAALREREISERHRNGFGETPKADELHEKGPSLLKELETIVQSRLWNFQDGPV